MEQYQTLTVVLANGKRCTYTGRVQLDLANQPNTADWAIVDVLVSKPRDLPPGMSFDQIPFDKTESVGQD